MIDPNNPYDLHAGDKAILDKGKPSETEVYIVRMTPNKAFSHVEDVMNREVKRSVMTDRLTPAKKLTVDK